MQSIIWQCTTPACSVIQYSFVPTRRLSAFRIHVHWKRNKLLFKKKLGNRAYRFIMLNCFEELQFDDCFHSQPYIEHFPTSNAIYWTWTCCTFNSIYQLFVLLTTYKESCYNLVLAKAINTCIYCIAGVWCSFPATLPKHSIGA